MKRVILFVNGTDVNGKVFMVTHSVEELLSAASTKFEISAKRIFTPQGGEIDDIKLISGEDFIYKNKVANDDQMNEDSEWITLNVGGKYFTTTRSTLTRNEPMSMLARMFTRTQKSDDTLKPSLKDHTGAFLIDRSPVYFEPLLNFLRHNLIILNSNVNVDGVLAEAHYYGMENAISVLTKMANEKNSPGDGLITLNRKHVVKAIMSTSPASELRFQGVNFSGADLSKLDLRNINFKYAVMDSCNLAGANLTGCCFERANLSRANLKGALLSCVRMPCANLASANLRSCNFEDPNGLPANMEGADFRDADFEGSNMPAVNLRVATLKNAILRNCDLRSAVLAGANLERCDLSGSDLQEANLRGANLKDATFELMLTPLHMSQTIR
ncbi:PREDICTED: BTB/POZ domain-containing protein KCTD9 isoform X2 [Polistes canadensis]|uniref:BTB/POZ domain-containing protein KCTD9 isoform X2 n=1 Tax=Polistes canadensis TaxID=91411 RepID=UPI000718E2D5|nr:PREDICTED: BTB/POZ domain-containing protein KCTD9 isoform X2 [Polistes canadensis]